MKKIFIDTDIVLDLIFGREPHSSAAIKLFQKIEQGKYAAYISALIVWNVYYIVEKYSSKKEAHQSIKHLRTILKIIPIDETIIDLALESDFRDFEDAIQYFAAKKHGIPVLITRNKKDYKKANIIIMNAVEYLNA